MLNVLVSPVQAFADDQAGWVVIEIGEFTVNTALLDVTAPHVPVTITRYVPASLVATLPMLNDAFVAPLMAVKDAPFCFCH